MRDLLHWASGAVQLSNEYNCPSLNPNSAYHSLINRFDSSLTDIKENMKS